MISKELLEKQITTAEKDFWNYSGQLLKHIQENHSSGWSSDSCKKCTTFRKTLLNNRDFVDRAKQEISKLNGNNGNHPD